MEAASFPFFFKKERYSVQPDPDGVYAGWVTPTNKPNTERKRIAVL
ncbi:hypothetical protein [Flavobacterium algoritolerans]|nr:hypothetical protein [Flavobacterium algoritolerans]